MNTTPNPDLDRLLREAMRPEPGDLAVPPSFAAEAVTRATRTRPRRRAVYAVAVPLLAAAVAAVIVVVVTRTTDTTPTPAKEPVEKLVDGDVPLSRWLENRTLDRVLGDPSKAAAAGTSMYRACDDGGACTVTLVSPSGREIDLADVSPDLAERLADDGLDGASLSPTGHWLGMPHDGGYRIYHPTLTVRVPASSDGDRWELVGWSEQSWAPTLALYDGDRLVRFANWDNLERDRVSYLDVPEGVVTTPFLGHRPYLSPVMDPIEPVDGRMPRVAATTPPTNEWFIVRRLYGPFTAGKIVDTSGWEGDYNGQSFESCVGPDETLAGPDGRIHRWETRGTRSVHADAVTVATAVFSRDVSRTEPVAVILWDCEPRGASSWGEELPDGGRLDLPTSTDSETWTFLGMLPYGEVALTHTVDGVPTYTRLTADGQLDPMYEMPADAEVITPGGVVGRG